MKDLVELYRHKQEEIENNTAGFSATAIKALDMVLRDALVKTIEEGKKPSVGVDIVPQDIARVIAHLEDSSKGHAHPVVAESIFSVGVYTTPQDIVDYISPVVDPNKRYVHPTVAESIFNEHCSGGLRSLSLHYASKLTDDSRNGVAFAGVDHDSNDSFVVFNIELEV